MTLDDIGGFARGIAPVLARTTEEFLLELGRNVVEEDGLFVRRWFFGR